MNSPKWNGHNKGSLAEIKKNAGMQINMRTPKIEMWENGNTGQGIYIDASRTSYPIQVGSCYNAGEGKDNLNLRIGWDGSLRGGSSYSWAIEADGDTVFNKINAKSGKIGNWTLSSTGLSGSGKITGGTIEGASISAGKINVGANGGYLRVGKGYTHPEVSGLNVTGSGGINMGSTGISYCTNIGGGANGGGASFSFSGSTISTASTLKVSGSAYLKIGDRTISEYVNDVIDKNLNDEIFDPGVTDSIILSDGVNRKTLHFTNGIFTGWTGAGIGT